MQQSSSSNHWRFESPRIAIYAALGVLAILIAFPLFAGGVPALQHDWQWPINRAQCDVLVRVGSEPWNRNGTGSAQIYPEAWWPYAFMGALCYAAGPGPSAGTFVLLMVLAAEASMLWLSRLLRVGNAASLIACVIYVANPVVLNEVQAGHTLFLFSYALLPALVAASLVRSRFRGAWCGLLLGLCAAQQQFLVVGAILLLVFLIRSPFVRSIIDLAVAFIIAAIISAPEWILALTPSATGAFNALEPTLHWESAQSASPALAVRLLGYIGHYDQHLPAAVQLALWSLPMIALIGLLAPARRAFAARFGAVAIVAVLLVCGLNGPLAAPLAFLFVHAPVSALFRELYVLSAIAALSYAVLAAFAIGSQRAASAAIVVGALAVIAVGCSVAIALRTSLDIPRYRIDIPGAALLDQIADASGNARYVAQPSLFPFALDDGPHVGKLPFAIGLAQHPAAMSELATFPLTYASLSYRTRPDLLQALDVGTILTVPRVREAFAQLVEPQFRVDARRLQPKRYYATWSVANYPSARIAVEPYRVAPGTVATRLRDATDLEPLSGGQAVNLVAAAAQADPLHSWGRTVLWPVLPTWVYAAPAAIFALRDEMQLSSPPALLVAGDASGRIHARGCTLRERLDSHFVVLSCGKDPTLRGESPLVVAEARTLAELVPSQLPTGSTGSVSEIHSAPWSIDVRVDASRKSALVLRESYDEGWRISVEGTTHVVVDGYANAWILPRDIHGIVRLWYAPASTFFAAWWTSIATVATGIFVAFTALLVKVVRSVAANLRARSGSEVQSRREA